VAAAARYEIFGHQEDGFEAGLGAVVAGIGVTLLPPAALESQGRERTRGPRRLSLRTRHTRRTGPLLPREALRSPALSGTFTYTSEGFSSVSSAHHLRVGHETPGAA
jgi:DNA-binding transcriptional LysR family regulator